MRINWKQTAVTTCERPGSLWVQQFSCLGDTPEWTYDSNSTHLDLQEHTPSVVSRFSQCGYFCRLSDNVQVAITKHQPPVSSFGSTKIMAESSYSMTNDGGEEPPPSSHPAPAPLPSFPPPRHPEYRSLESRLGSFVGWPERLVGQNPRSLAACGFFYMGSADRVRCFQCGVTLRNWEAEDDPATEHLTWAPDCPVALLPPDTQSQTGFRDVQAPPENGAESGAGGGGEGSGFESSMRNFEQFGVNLDGAEINPEQSGVAHNSEAGGTPRTASAAPAARVVDPPSLLEPHSDVGLLLELGYHQYTVDRVRERRRGLDGTDPDAVSLQQAAVEEGRRVEGSASRNLEQRERNEIGAESSVEVSRRTQQSDVASFGNAPQHNIASSAASVSSSGVPASGAAVAAGGDPPSVQAVLELGCSRDTVDRVRERRRREEGTDFPDAPSLLQAVLEEEEENEISHQRPEPVTVEDFGPLLEIRDPCCSAISLSSSTPQPRPVERGTGGRNGLKCMYCVREREMLLLPCGHFIFCSTCVRSHCNCPVCGRKILGTVRVFRP